ncbi:MAG: CCA tRNA nucleotidyltransferase [Peptococcaceae bacterium]|jgi:tRNA nucleotidyltransferase (CCA-adding enzyme)|nr:CCA tRNA nucleotidyltransferase [Peptococcaceae bacterium]
MKAIPLPENIAALFAFLGGNDLPAWLVGGCLRDYFLAKPPADWDFATPCPPAETGAKLRRAGLRVLETGRRHGTLTFIWREKHYEITTFRADGPYSDHRRPDWVSYTDCLEKDLARRDFTVNAMAYRPEEGLRDPFGGLADLERRLVRAVGEAPRRLAEDPLRILRGVRFAAGLGGELEASLGRAITAQAASLRQISPERVAGELRALLLLPDPRVGLALLAELALWPYIIPEMTATVGFAQHSAYHYLDVYDHMCLTAANAPADLSLRLAALLHDIGKPAVFTLDGKGKGHFKGHERAGGEIAGRALERLRFSHRLRDQVVLLIEHHMLHLKTLRPPALRRILAALPPPRRENLERILLLQKADLLASRYTAASLAEFEDFAAGCRAILDSGCSLDIRDLAVDGRDLVALGVPPAARARTLAALLDEALERPELNRREILLARAAALANSESSRRKM